MNEAKIRWASYKIRSTSLCHKGDLMNVPQQGYLNRESVTTRQEPAETASWAEQAEQKP